MNSAALALGGGLTRTIQDHPWVVLALLLLLAGLVGLVLGRGGRVQAAKNPDPPTTGGQGCLDGLRKDLEAQFGPIDDESFEDALGTAIQEVLERRRQEKVLEGPDKEKA